MNTMITTFQRFLLAAMVIMLSVFTLSANRVNFALTLENEKLVSHHIQAPDGKDYILYGASGAEYIGDRGDLAIPYKCFSFIIPTLATNVDIIDLGYETGAIVDLKHSYYPIQPDRSINDGESNCFEEADENVYLRKLYPMIFTDRIVDGNLRYLTIGIPLLQTTGYPNSLIEVKSFNIAIDYESGDRSKPELGFLPLGEVSNNKTVQAVTDSESLLNDNLGSNKKSLVSDFGEECQKVASPHYVIIVPEDLKNGVEQLKHWKSQKGFNVEVATVEEILNDACSEVFVTNGMEERAFDRDSHIRNWLRYKYLEKGNYNLLIVGDYLTSAPIRKFKHLSSYSNWPWYARYDSENFVPTDSYFSDLTTRYVINQKTEDGFYYGYIKDQAYYSPELPVGRILANKEEHITNYTNKLLIYEIDPGLGDAEYLDRVLVSRQYQHHKYPSLLGHLRTYSDSIILRDTLGVVDFNRTSPVGKDVVDALNRCGLASLMGHGSPLTLARSGASPWSMDTAYYHYRYIQAHSSNTMADLRHKYYDPNNGLDLVKNINKPGVIYSLSCDVTPFDNIYHPTRGYRTTSLFLGASYTVGGKDYGGVAFIGNTRTGYDGVNILMELDFGKRISEGYSLGSAVYLSNSILPKGSRYSQFTRNLIGDPDISIWQGKPRNPSASISYVNDEIIAYGPCLNTSRVVLSDGKGNSSTFMFDSELGSISHANSGIPPGEDLIVSIFNNNELPLMQPFPCRGTSISEEKHYYLRDWKLVNPFNPDSYFYTVADEGLLNLYMTEGGKSEKGFKVENGGKVKVNCSKDVTLNRDKIEAGGKMEVKANTLTLGAGFEIEKGGEFSFANN